MLHLYWGDGKGKTTAAMGLALRALGHRRKVVIVQFLKDGTSGEIEPLRRL
ncbi:cob(I)yrinic acid a,c-diamide adenosyltransferase, partial [Gemmiger formicilis]